MGLPRHHIQSPVLQRQNVRKFERFGVEPKPVAVLVHHLGIRLEGKPLLTLVFSCGSHGVKGFGVFRGGVMDIDVGLGPKLKMMQVLLLLSHRRILDLTRLPSVPVETFAHAASVVADTAVGALDVAQVS